MSKYLPHGSQFHFGISPDQTGFTGDQTTDIITKTAHGYRVNDAIRFVSVTGGTGIVLGQTYYVFSTPSANTFTISESPGGPIHDFTTAITAATVKVLRFIGGLISVGFPDASKEEAETTDTYSGGSREFIPGLRDFGSVELGCRHDPEDAGQGALDANFLALKDVQPCLITLADGATAAAELATYAFNGFVNAGPTGDLPLADSEAAEVGYTIRVTGPVTKTVALP